MDSDIEHTNDTADAPRGLTDLTAFQIDVLLAIPRAEAVAAGLPNGTSVADALAAARGKRPASTMLYPALERLEEAGYLEKEILGGNDGNGLRLTDAGIARVQGIANAASESVYLARGGRDE